MGSPHSKEDAQFWVAIVSVAALALITGASLIADQFHGAPTSQTTSLLAGGLISVCAASASWLFRNGNGHGPGGEATIPEASTPQKVASV